MYNNLVFLIILITVHVCVCVVTQQDKLYQYNIYISTKKQINNISCNYLRYCGLRIKYIVIPLRKPYPGEARARGLHDYTLNFQHQLILHGTDCLSSIYRCFLILKMLYYINAWIEIRIISKDYIFSSSINIDS